MSFTIASASVLAGAFVHFSAPEPGVDPTPVPQASSSAPVTQNGTVIAVTSDSVTTCSDDGAIQTYRITPQTTAVTSDRQQAAHPAANFAVDDRVSVFTTFDAGQHVATAVADQDAVGPNGPPMDFVTVP